MLIAIFALCLPLFATDNINLIMAKAEQGDAIAQNILGNRYANGKGVEKDEVEAVKWYLKAAEQGDDFAQFNLSLCYAKGKGVE